MFFDDELVELTVRETNTYAAQKIQARSFIPLRSRMRDWKPVTKDEMYVVLALYMLMGIIQKPTLRSYFSKNYILATPIFGSIISMDRFESICSFMHFNNNDHIGTYQGPSKLFKIYPVLPNLNTKFHVCTQNMQHLLTLHNESTRDSRGQNKQVCQSDNLGVTPQYNQDLVHMGNFKYTSFAIYIHPEIHNVAALIVY